MCFTEPPYNAKATSNTSPRRSQALVDWASGLAAARRADLICCRTSCNSARNARFLPLNSSIASTTSAPTREQPSRNIHKMLDQTHGGACSHTMTAHIGKPWTTCIAHLAWQKLNSKQKLIQSTLACNRAKDVLGIFNAAKKHSGACAVAMETPHGTAFGVGNGKEAWQSRGQRRRRKAHQQFDRSMVHPSWHFRTTWSNVASEA